MFLRLRNLQANAPVLTVSKTTTSLHLIRGDLETRDRNLGVNFNLALPKVLCGLRQFHHFHIKTPSRCSEVVSSPVSP